MSFRQFTPPIRIWNCLAACCAALVLAGCSSSTDRSAANEAAEDIRGEPINSPVSNTTHLAQSPSPVASSGATGTGSAGPNAPAGLSNAASVAADGAKADAESPGHRKDGEFVTVGFDKLASFTFEMPEEPAPTNQLALTWKSKDQIPPTVKAFDQKSVAIKGFMLPLKVENGLVTEMLIMRDQSMCCYGTVPKINEWVSVKMVQKGVKAVMDQPVTIFGKLRVGEMRENGYLVGIYQLDGQKMAGPADM